jgi:Holliday junction resolvase
MAMTPESKVKKKCVEQLKAMGALYFYPVTGGFSTNGVSDIIVCVHGLFIAIECKAGKKKPTELQKLFLARTESAGGLALVINEGNVDELTALISHWCDR